LSAEKAARLSAWFIRDAAENITAAAKQAAIDLYIAYSPAGAEAEFASLLADGTQLLLSRRIGLGASLYDADEDLLAAGYGSVCLVNSDSPTLPVDPCRRRERTAHFRRSRGPWSGGGRRLLPDRLEAAACSPV
jgi:hypothetical protein